MGLQMEAYRGRTEWIEDGIAEGNVTLKIRKVQPSDEGQYWCRFQENYWRETSLHLQVAALGSSPNTHLEGPGEEGEAQLVCTSRGWFPEPRVYWEDIRGKTWLTFSENHVPGEDGLFYAEDTLVIKNDSIETKEKAIALPEKLQTELASLKVIGPSQPIVVRVGEDIELACHLSPRTDARSMEVRWVRSHRYPAMDVYVEGDHVAGEQMAEYRGRTVLVRDAVHEGKLTLQIHDARTSDDGQYRCLFEKDGVYQEATLDVQVAAVGSTLLIVQEVLKDGETQLRCISSGWFPQPRVQWRDGEGKPIPSFSEALHQGSQKLFHMETLLLVTNSSMVNVTCSISSLPLGEEKAAVFTFSEPNVPSLWKILPLLGFLLAMAVSLIKMKSCTNDQNHNGEQATDECEECHRTYFLPVRGSREEGFRNRAPK